MSTTAAESDDSNRTSGLDLASAIREARQRVGLTGEDMAERLGIARSTYFRYEDGGRRVPFDLLPALAQHLEVTLASLVAAWSDVEGRTPIPLTGDAARDALGKAVAASWAGLTRQQIAVISWALTAPSLMLRPM